MQCFDTALFCKLYARKKSNVGIFVACQPKDWDNHFDQHFFAIEDFSLLMAKKCSKIKDVIQAVKKQKDMIIMKTKSKLIIAGAALAGAASGAAAVYFGRKNCPQFKKKTDIAAGKSVNKIFEGLATVLPEMNWQNKIDYKSENFMAGHTKFIKEPAKNNRWQLGFSSKILTPDDYSTEDYYLGGYLHFPANKVTGVIDDEMVRTVCLNDSSGRGSAVFVVIDCACIGGGDVRKIRERLAGFAKENNIVSINVSATHCHSAVDTFGLWGDLPKIVKNNFKALRQKRFDDLISGKNKTFMEKLFTLTEQSVVEAYADMKPGKLYFCENEDLAFSRDTRPPYVRTKDITRIRFTPDDGSRETIAVIMAAHAIAVGYDNTEISADHIYYMDEILRDAGKNFIHFQGAELAVRTQRSGIVPENSKEEGWKEYGWALGRYLLNLPPEKDEEIEPVLNIKLAEIFIPASNYVLLTMAKMGIVSNIILKTGKKAADTLYVTEVGYAELGRRLRLALIPGEMAPEMLLGGTFTAEESYNNTEWEHLPMKDMLPAGTSLKIIGLCNDLVGYILPDNDFGSIFAKDHYEEMASAGIETGPAIVEAFKDLAESVL